MPRLRVIVLEKVRPDLLRYALWADVPLARQPFYASTGKTSAWNGATSADLANLQTGAVAETLGLYNVYSTTVAADFTVKAQADWTTWQNFVNANDPWSFYGSTWDGTTWVSTGAA